MQATVGTYTYTLGETTATRHARLETKPTSGPGDTGGGYEHFRSNEFRDDDPRDSRVDVYASHHRLLAVAWNVANEETGEPLLPDGYEGVVDMGVLVGNDVHHNAPEADADRGVPWDNREACLSWLSHGRHSGLTQAERQAYAEDQKRVRDGEWAPDKPACDADGCDADPWGRVAGGEWCPEHAKANADGESIEVL